MAGESNSIRVAILTIILTSFLLLPTPIVSANQSGVTIEGNSINLDNFQTTDDSFFNLEFNLSATDDGMGQNHVGQLYTCLLYTSPSPRDMRRSRMPSSA